jgi:hypothetical protein
MRTIPALAARRVSHWRGFTLLECVVYLGLFSLLLGIASLAYYRCFDNMRGLRRNADDITRALNAGELWRDDVRTATGPVQFVESGQIFRIPRREGEALYQFAESQVLRKAKPDAPWVVLLPAVQRSQMEADVRAHVTAWRWELELQPGRKPVRVRPAFTFLAVPGATNQP